MAHINIEDKRKYQREWYRKNRTKQINWSLEYKRKIKIWFKNYKKTLKCESCGENHIACLDFHHDKGYKHDTISMLVCNGRSKKVILAEIKKCIVVCSNCHRKIHFEK